MEITLNENGQVEKVETIDLSIFISEKQAELNNINQIIIEQQNRANIIIQQLQSLVKD